MQATVSEGKPQLEQFQAEELGDPPFISDETLRVGSEYLHVNGDPDQWLPHPQLRVRQNPAYRSTHLYSCSSISTGYKCPRTWQWSCFYCALIHI